MIPGLRQLLGRMPTTYRCPRPATRSPNVASPSGDADVGRANTRRSACESQLIGLLAVANRTGLTGHASGLVRGVVLGFGEAWRLSPSGDRPRTPARCWRCGPGCAAKGFSFTAHGGHQRGAGTHQATDAIASGQCARGYRGRIGGTRKRGSTVASNRVIALTRSPEREKTSTPLGWAMRRKPDAQTHVSPGPDHGGRGGALMLPVGLSFPVASPVAAPAEASRAPERC